MKNRNGRTITINSAEWNEDADADAGRDRAISEFKKHTGGEPVFTAEKVKGTWYAITTELGAYRLGRKYRFGWKNIGEHKAHRGKWYVKIGK